jgi:glycerophosphoryl diester phosphodiesterase
MIVKRAICLPLVGMLLASFAALSAQESATPQAVVAHRQDATLHRLVPQTPAGLQEFLNFANGPLPIVSGHRGGAWQSFPENCIPTFEHTLAHTFAMLEIDPRYAKDGNIVVHHDATLERTTTGQGRVVDFTVPELKQLRLKDLNGQVTEFSMPTLDEVIDWARGKTVLVLDQKDVSAVDRATVVAKHQAEAYVMLIVSSFKDVQAVHTLNPNIMMEVMIPTRAKAEEFDTLGVPWRNVVAFVGHVPPDDAALYEFIHGKGARCMIGTSRNLDRRLLTRQVTDLKPLEPDYRAFLRRGADIIETDLPSQLGQLLYREAAVPRPLQKYFQAPKSGDED